MKEVSMAYKVAVIMSLYRGDRLTFVKEALESLYMQSYPVDIFVQQDGPIDAAVEVLVDDALINGKIHYLGKRGKNRGLAYSLNELIEQVQEQRYRYIARMDADDISLPDRIAKQVAFLESNQEVDVAGGYIEEFSDEVDYHKIVQYPLKHDEMFRFFAKRVPLAHVSVMYRDRFFEKAGLYPTTSPTNEDTLMWMEGFRNGCRFANIPEVLVRVRISKAFFGRRGGLKKAWSDLKDRLKVIKTLGYNSTAYGYALAVFMVNISPSGIKKFLYKRVR